MKRLRLVLLMVMLTILTTGCDKDAPVEVSTQPMVTDGVEVQEDYGLPEETEISPVKHPLLYDFIVGCLDWHVSINRGVLESDLYLMRNTKAPETIYTDWYPIQAGYTVPPLGSKVETVELSVRQLDMYNTVVSEIPEAYVLREGDWELVIYAGDAARAFQQYDFDFRSKYRYTDARVPPFIASGAGWPTEWLRREPYCASMREAGIEILDGWFDLFQYRSEYVLLKDDGTSTEEGYSVVCTGVREFALKDGTGKMSFGLTWDNVRETCNALQCNLGDFYHHGDWTPEFKSEQ